MRLRLISFIVLGAVLACAGFSCSGPSYEQLAATLLEGAPPESEKAAKKLASNPMSLPRCAATLVVRDEKTRKKFLHVLELAGERALRPMTDNIRYIRISKDHFTEFVDFFRKEGAKGYDALHESYRLHASTLKDVVERKDFGANAMSHQERMNDLTRVIIAHPDQRVGSLPDILFHPFDITRAQVARLLCVKGWRPPGDVDPQKEILYYSHIIFASGCPAAGEALNHVVSLGRRNLEDFLAIEDRYPAPAGTRYEVLAKIGNDQVVRYAKKNCLETDNHFIFIQYYKVLKRIDSTAAKTALKEVIKREDIQDLFGDVQVDKIEKSGKN